MSSLNKIIVKKANLTVDEDIQFAGDKRDPNNEQLSAESISQNEKPPIFISFQMVVY